MELLVLGGTGAMGTYLVDICLKKGCKVSVTSRSRHVSDNENLTYLEGNAMDPDFLRQILQKHYDAIVDFMVYSTTKFEEHMPVLLGATDHYLFLSSARVYADSDKPLTEDAPRLLETHTNEKYLTDHSYGIYKAQQENLLRSSAYKNWTIIRPYITYSEERLQLGVLEKEYWLYRALQGRTIVFSKDIAEHVTTLTHGYDVALLMAAIIGNRNAFCESFHITGEQVMKWKDVLAVYLRVIEEKTGKRPEVRMEDSSSNVARVLQGWDQICFDRMYDRRFDNRKILGAVGEEVQFTSIETGLTECLSRFLEGKRAFRTINPRYEGYADRITKEKTALSAFPSSGQRIRYLLFRYFPLSFAVAAEKLYLQLYNLRMK